VQYSPTSHTAFQPNPNIHHCEYLFLVNANSSNEDDIHEALLELLLYKDSVSRILRIKGKSLIDKQRVVKQERKGDGKER